MARAAVKGDQTLSEIGLQAFGPFNPGKTWRKELIDQGGVALREWPHAEASGPGGGHSVELYAQLGPLKLEVKLLRCQRSLGEVSGQSG